MQKFSLLFAATAVSADSLWKEFIAFKQRFEIEFESLEEDSRRFHIFSQNKKLWTELNERSNGKTEFGATKFAHLTTEEFKKTYLGYKKTEKQAELKKKNKKYTLKGLFSKGGASSIDWRKLGGTSPVKDQGQCGSCWAFSATEAAESAFWKATNEMRILAPQQTTSCDDVDYGCNGGNTETAYDYMRQAGGVEKESDYPYTSGTTERTGRCKANSSLNSVKVGATTAVAGGPEDESNMLEVIQDSPISICVDAEPWQFYFGGVIDSSTCGTSLDHCVHLVAYKGGDDDWWVVKNSWNTNWGEDGYIRVKQGENACGVAEDATIVDASDESKEPVYV